MFAVVVAGALLSLVLGFSGAALASALDPVVEAVVDSSPVVGEPGSNLDTNVTTAVEATTEVSIDE
jgi:hypothetical protein